MSVTVWRIASDTPDYTADDMTGKGAETTGGRWSRKGTPLINTATNRALACLETVVHFNAADLPLNRYLIEIQLPLEAWTQRTVFDRVALVGWDAEPPGRVSLDWGTDWVASRTTLLAEVPSVIVLEESNVLINPRHPDAASVTVRKVRRWIYDARIWSAS